MSISNYAPTNPDHLWYTLNVLDWPQNDRDGQIQRVLDSTFYDQLSSEQIAAGGAEPQLKDGDLRLIPTLEIEIPFQNGHYGNLPVMPGAPPISTTTPLTTWLDIDTMADFGINVRKLDESSGTLLAYVPLTLIEDGEGAGPVAFSGRMFYQPISTDFGPIQEARLIWMVEVLTNTCTPVPDDFEPEGVEEKDRRLVWCEDPANWQENGSTIVHIYEDEWVLTGMTVREDRGVEAAVIFQDPVFTAAQPGYTPDGFHDDHLWTLSQGLDRTFLAGRGAGTLDLTISEIAARWDKDLNPGTTLTETWNIPLDAFHVETYSFDHLTEMMAIPVTHTKQILADHFTAQADLGGIQDPTLMILRQERLRLLAIDQTDFTSPIGSNGLSLTLDTTDIPEFSLAAMSWGPFQYQGAGSWAAYPIEEYINDKRLDFETVLGDFWADADDVIGARLIAQSYYMTVHAGLSKVVEAAGTPANLPLELDDAAVLDYIYGATSAVNVGFAVNNLTTNFGGLINFIQTSFASATQAILSPLSLLEFNLNPLGFYKGNPPSLTGRSYSGGTPTGNYKVITSGYLERELRKGDFQWRPSDIKRAYSRVNGGAVKPKAVNAGTRPDAMQTKIAKAFRQGGLLSQATAIVGAVATIGQIIVTATGDINTVEVALVFASIQATVNFINVISAASTISVLIAASGIKFAQTLIKGIGRNLYGFLFAFLISAVVSVGMFIFQAVSQNLEVGSLPFNYAFASLVASLIVAVIFIAISSVPIFGQFVAAIIGLIDSVINIICLATGATEGNAGEIVQNYVCPGITGLLTKAVQFLIYDQTPTVDLSNPNRLNLTNFNLNLSDQTAGFTAGNSVNIELEVQTALYVDPFDLDDVSLFLPYRYQFGDEFLVESTFDYEILPGQFPITADIALNQMTGLWQPPMPDSWAPDSNFVVTKTMTSLPVPFGNPGINRPLNETFLVEGYAINVQECFTIPPVFPIVVPVPVCYLREDVANNYINLGQGLVFDVLPATLDEFMTLSARADGGYTLQWWTNFPAPTLADADGDGLRSAAVGGNDPNDSLPDTDLDTLSDYYEILIGTDPIRADIDNDNLNDAEELKYGTDPFLADTDGDGLPDNEEIAGWAFVYDFVGSVPQTTWVWSDPLNPNQDGDSYLDAQEKQYSFNPAVVSSDAILSFDSEILDENSNYQPGEQVNYQVTLGNELDISHLFGLLDVELPTAVQGNVTPQNFQIAPQTTVSLTEQLTVSGSITQSQVVSFTNRAGALAIDLNSEINGRTLWLHLEENVGGGVYMDSSLKGNDASCSGGSCPVEGAVGYQGLALDFDGGDFLEIDATAEDLGFVRDSYTVQAWVYADNFSGERTLLGHQDGTIGFGIGFNAGRPKFKMDPSLTTTSTLTTGRWYRVTWRYDHRADEYSIFVDGEQVLSESGIGFDHTQLNNETLTIGTFGLEAYFDGRLDEIDIFPFALSDDAIADSIGQGSALVFYNAFEVSPIPDSVPFPDDSEYLNSLEIPLASGHEDNYYYLSPSHGQTGFVDEAYQFGQGDTDSDVLYANPNPNLDLSRGIGAFTISAWVNKLPLEGGWVMGHNVNGTEMGYPALRVDGDEVTVQFGLSPNVCSLVSNSGGVLNGPTSDLFWHHVAATFDGVTLTIYVNNVAIGSQNCAGKKAAQVSDFYIGNRYNSAAGQGFQGFLGRTSDLQLRLE